MADSSDGGLSAGAEAARGPGWQRRLGGHHPDLRAAPCHQGRPFPLQLRARDGPRSAQQVIFVRLSTAVSALLRASWRYGGVNVLWREGALDVQESSGNRYEKGRRGWSVSLARLGNANHERYSHFHLFADLARAVAGPATLSERHKAHRRCLFGCSHPLELSLKGYPRKLQIPRISWRRA